MASGTYNRWRTNLMNKEVDMVADVIKVILLNNSHTFNPAHNVIGDIDTNELSTAGGYTQKTKVLDGKTVTQAAAVKFDGTDVEWAGATFSAWHAALYDDTVAADDLIGSIDFGGEKIVAAGLFKIQWHVNGIITLAAA